VCKTPGTSFELDHEGATLDLPVSSVDRLNLAETNQVDNNRPPMKKMCFDAEQCPNFTMPAKTTQTFKINPRTGEKCEVKKTQVFESILSLLVKIYYRNQTEIIQNTVSTSNTPFVELNFLKTNQARKVGINH